MTRWQHFKRWVRIAWQGECRIDGCERGVVGKPFHYTELCDEHFDQNMREVAKRIAQRDFDREVAIHAEALRRVNAENERAD